MTTNPNDAAAIRAAAAARRADRTERMLDAYVESSALEVICRVFPDGADAGYQEWLDWYKPEEWFHPARALGAFIAQRLKSTVPPPAEHEIQVGPAGNNYGEDPTYEEALAEAVAALKADAPGRRYTMRPADEMREEYDFSTGIRGKYAERTAIPMYIRTFGVEKLLESAIEYLSTSGTVEDEYVVILLSDLRGALQQYRRRYGK